MVAPKALSSSPAGAAGPGTTGTTGTDQGVELEQLAGNSSDIDHESSPSPSNLKSENRPSEINNEKPTSPASASVQAPAEDDGPPDPFAHLPAGEAAILKRQVETPERKYSTWHVYRYATKLDILIIVISGITSCASGAAMPAMTIIFGGLQGVFQDYMYLGTISYREFEQEVASFILYFVYLAIGTFFATYISTVGFIYTGEHITTNLRQKYLESCLRQNIGFFDQLGAGEVAVKITSDANRIQDGISEKIGLLLAALATVITGFVIGFVVSWKLTLIMSSVVVAFVLNTAIWTMCLVKYAVPMALAAIQTSSLTQEVFSAVRVAIAFGSQTRLVKQFDGLLKAAQSYGVKVKTAVGMMMAVIMGLMHLIYGLGFWQGSLFISRGELELDRMLTGLMAVMVGSLTVGSIGQYYQSFIDAVGTVARLAAVIDRDSPLDGTSPDKGYKPENIQGHLRLESLKHIYPSRPDVIVMDGVSLDFEAGQTTALVGASGSGKSTIVGLIERFYDPVQGKVFLDGRDLSTLNLRWLRQQVRLVGQEPVLFAGSVLDNIQYGLVGSEYENLPQDKQKELIINAAKTANAHDFILQLSQGYDTDVGQRGLLLSGGQKQRVAIARAIVSNPKILLLDEATSALDTKSEGIVQAALDQAGKGRTTITIAHRISTVRDAHKIVVMSQGKVVEQGSHKELLHAQGAYYELVNAQQFNNKEAPQLSGDSSDEDLDREYETHKLSQSSDVDASRHGDGAVASTAPLDGGETSDDAPQYSFWTLLKFVSALGKQEMHWMLVAFFLCIICGLATPVQAVFFAKQLITLSQIGAPGSNLGKIQGDSNFWSLMFLMLGLVTFACYAAQGAILGYTAEALMRRVRRQTFDSMLRQDVAFFDRSENSPSALTATLSVETTQLTNMSGSTLGSITVSLSILIGGIALSLAIGWKLALVCLAVVPLLVVCSLVRFYVLYKYTDRASRVYIQSAAYASENIAAMRTVASLTLEGMVASKYKSDINAQLKQSLVSVSKSGALYAASQSAIFLCLGLAFWYGSTLMARFEYDVFQFFVCLMSIVFGAQSAGSLLTFIPDIVKARHSAAYLKALFDRKPSIGDNAEGRELSQTKGKLEFCNVHFHYPTRPEIPVLRGLDLVVEPGQHVALVGASGCGKSTTIALLERFYDPIIGQVRLDGVNIADLQVSSYRSHIALVSQEPALFQGTIRDNIAMSSKYDSISDEAIEVACRDAAIHEFIVSLPEGLGTDIGSAGALLSGGQKQRIAIARALVRKPKVLLLDEATSALDSESEKIVQEALERAAKGRTTVTVAHRLSTIQKADRIYVIDQGGVVEYGNHSELMARNGRYAELVKLQSFGE